MKESRIAPEAVSQLEDVLLAMDRIAVKRILETAAAGQGALQAVEELVIPALESLGNRFESGEVAISQIYMSGKICDDVIDSIMPASDAVNAASHPLIASCVLEDSHALGKKILDLTLASAGYQVVDYGVGLSAEELEQRALTERPRVLLISVLMLPSALKIGDLAERLRQSPGGEGIHIVAGGAPFRFDAGLETEIGVEVAQNASDAIDIVKELLQETGKAPGTQAGPGASGKNGAA